MNREDRARVRVTFIRWVSEWVYEWADAQV